MLFINFRWRWKWILFNGVRYTAAAYVHIVVAIFHLYMCALSTAHAHILRHYVWCGMIQGNIMAFIQCTRINRLKIGEKRVFYTQIERNPTKEILILHAFTYILSVILLCTFIFTVEMVVSVYVSRFFMVQNTMRNRKEKWVFCDKQSRKTDWKPPKIEYDW